MKSPSGMLNRPVYLVLDPKRVLPVWRPNSGSTVRNARVVTIGRATWMQTECKSLASITLDRSRARPYRNARDVAEPGVLPYSARYVTVRLLDADDIACLVRLGVVAPGEVEAAKLEIERRRREERLQEDLDDAAKTLKTLGVRLTEGQRTKAKRAIATKARAA